MGYQALLFCPDEKLARVVTQVFSDLEFSVELVNEPFSAVKKLMAQRYDALVVDCENEQNASLLFKSARNSSSNQSSLALALVEGQAGVAKAYRIGANLVLTKPINVEQAKGTLRVARGLLRKNLDAAPSQAPVKAAPAPATSSFREANQETATVLSAPDTFESPELESALPQMAASAQHEVSSVHTPVPEAIAPAATEAPMLAKIRQEVSATLPEKPVAAPVSPVPAKVAMTSPVASSGSAAAPAPAKEPAPAEKRSMAPEFVGHASVSAPLSVPPSPPSQIEAPTFAALTRDEDSGGSGGSKKILAVAAVIVVAATLGYFGWTKLGQKSTSAEPGSAPQSMSTSATPTPATTTVPSVSNEPVSSQSAATSSAPQSSKAASSATALSTRTEPEPEVETSVNKRAAPAIVVKSMSAPKKSSAQAEESAPQLPNPLALEPASDKHISNLVASAPVNLPKVAPSNLRISQGVSQGLVIKKVPPRYPQSALSMRVQGAVQLEATIDKEGNVKNLKVISGDPTLARAAADAVRQWRYKPYYLDGDPVEIQTQITVNFKLPN
jgi:TonB family protein